jgi:hypothetical protein
VLKNIEFHLNTKGLTFSFTKKRLFMMKIDQKSIILPREGHIMVQLDVIVLYINFHLKAQVGYPLVL